MKDFFKKFELYIGSVFIAVTVIVVIMNVFTRYVLKFTFFLGGRACRRLFCMDHLFGNRRRI